MMTMTASTMRSCVLPVHSFTVVNACGQSYGNRTEALRHWAVCNVHGASCHVVDRSCLCVNRFIELKQVDIARHTESNENLKKIEVTQNVLMSTLFGAKWAQRPAKGGTLGKNFLEPFKAEIKAMVERGETDNGKKLSCGKMQEQLQLSHPSRFDIPNVHSINSYVKTCLRCIPKGEANAKRAA